MDNFVGCFHRFWWSGKLQHVQYHCRWSQRINRRTVITLCGRFIVEGSINRMPLDAHFQARYEGYFHERVSHAPRFSHATRFPVRHVDLTPGPGGPVQPPRPAQPRAVIGTAKRQDLWLIKDIETRHRSGRNSISNDLSGRQVTSARPPGRTTPSVLSPQKGPYEASSMFHNYRSGHVSGVKGTFSHATRFYDPITKQVSEERSLVPGPGAYGAPVAAGTFEHLSRTQTPPLSRRNSLGRNTSHARSASVTKHPKEYVATALGSARGGAIPRSGRSRPVIEVRGLDVPGPGSYTPKYGLLA